MESSPPKTGTEVPNVAGVKRPASLLPAFEPSSSPPLPRPSKRVARDSEIEVSKYPTPVPTSSTVIPTSSPSRAQHSRPSLHSMLSERTPLSTVSSIMLSETGETISMGRSSASCDYQLLPSRLISRVHVRASYKPPSNPFGRGQVEILCTGWNGIKLHCQGKTYELTKGKTFTSDIKDADIMIDVQNTRVLVQWPRPERKDSTSSVNSNHMSGETSLVKNQQSSARRHTIPTSSPPRKQRPASPVSPSPAVQSLANSRNPLLTPSRSSAVVVYEDEPSPTRAGRPSTDSTTRATQSNTNLPTENIRNSTISSFSSKEEEFSEHDEENDPIVHSFALSENAHSRMPSYQERNHPARSPPHRTDKASTPPPPPSTKTTSPQPGKDKVQNHAVNQLAFSRLSSTPLSTILSNLPPKMWKRTPSATHGFSKEEIRDIIEGTPCIGVVSREGKDAAGKPLESEYYYVAEFDEDEMRKEAVVHELRKPGLRNCRKQHKVRFSSWYLRSLCIVKLYTNTLCDNVAILLAEA